MTQQEPIIISSYCNNTIPELFDIMLFKLRNSDFVLCVTILEEIHNRMKYNNGIYKLEIISNICKYING